MPPIPIRCRPGTDWTCREVLDANAIDPTGRSSCEFCGTRIRWIHVLEHDNYHRTVEAGCCCAARLCFEYNAEGAEREAKNRAGRTMRFVDPRRWARSKSNPENIWRFARLPDGRKVRVTVFLKDGRYSIYLAGREVSDRFCHWEKYASQAEAVSVAFELIEKLKDDP